ncbi:LacI family DNA-binding transcriptional regulator [Labrys wisconsinensis]|uniref:LacI family gluconate utilization system Gnt-I transcriptional repressor n=1 Tax=Labrys wisconsinensis TaxID=425677 RepID=A0ABU0JGR2_9HYPH|nr:LacI family DNA-binding transcriptional regulator [Labrys wisconsinensis]MDQ0473480.1 LacI family gluconate utilization system Gnt-I transcriptional repressor [Labrys wisconsinensis]
MRPGETDVAPGQGRRRTTLSDVAARAGVSPVTVSRALRRPDMVSADLRARIDQAVRELAYIPNQLASALASARTHMVGVVIPSLTNGVFADYLRALHDLFVPAGIQLLVSNSRYSPVEEEAAIATILGQSPEAIIVAGIDQTARARRLLERAGIPVVQTMELAEDPVDINIGLSQHEAGLAATRYLIGLGHRRIGHISARLDPRSRRRAAGYAAAMEQAGLGREPLLAATLRPSTVALGAELLGSLLARERRLEAAFCCNDDLALGALFECQRRGIRVPGDIALIGFNDLEFCASAFPSLSSVAVPRYEMGRRAGEIVLEVIRGSGNRPATRRIDLGFAIRERQSTSPRDAAGQAGRSPAASQA